MRQIQMTELIWDGKYKGNKKQGPVRIALPFQTIETVNESDQDRRRDLELFATGLSPFRTYLTNLLRSPKSLRMPPFGCAPPICEIASTDWTVYFLTDSISPIDWEK